MADRFRTLIVSLLAVVLLVWFMRDANLGEVWRQIRHARVDWIIASAFLVFLSYALRAIRWQLLLRPIGPTRFGTAFRTTIIGFAVSFLLPARAGELLRPYLLARREGLNATSTFATIVMERVLDLFGVVVLLATFVTTAGAAASSVPLMPSIQMSAVAAAVAVVVLMAVLWTLASHPERIGRLVLRADRVLPHRLVRGFSKTARTFSEGCAVARRPGALALATLWSFPLWIVIAAETWLVTEAFGIEMPFLGSFLLQAMLVVGVAVPTPGAVGGFHEAYRLGTTVFFGASNDAAVGAALALHAISFVPATIVGVLLMAGDGLSLGGVRGLAGVAREQEVPSAHEMPVLRSPGR